MKKAKALLLLTATAAFALLFGVSLTGCGEKGGYVVFSNVSPTEKYKVGIVQQKQTSVGSNGKTGKYDFQLEEDGTYLVYYGTMALDDYFHVHYKADAEGLLGSRYVTVNGGDTVTVTVPF